MGFFDLLGSFFGYILWFFFDATSNYALAIVLFAVLINILMFPLAVKRQKSTAGQARLAEKTKDLKKKFGNNKQKFAEEQAKLYEREGISPFSGCSAMFLPLILWVGIYGAIRSPLKNTLHISQDKINSAMTVVNEIPGNEGKGFSTYGELFLVKDFSDLKDKLTMFNNEELDDISEYSSGFNFLGLNLLDTPKNTPFKSMLWIIPAASFIISAVSMYIMQKMSGMSDQVQGAMKIFPYMMLIFTSYIAYTIPGAVGLYWIINSIIGMIQGIVLNKYYNVLTLNAGDEASKFLEMQIKDKSVAQIKDPSSVIVDKEKIFPVNGKK